MKQWGIWAALLLLIASGITQAQETSAYIAYVGMGPQNTDIFVADLASGRVRNITNNSVQSAHPSWSGDGTQLVFNNVIDGNPELFVMRDNGLGLRNVSNSPAFDISPDWSPIASEIAFISNRDDGPDTFDLYVLDLATEETRRLTSDGLGKNRPDWSPDGTQIAYWQTNPDGNTALMLYDLASSSVSTLVAEGENLWPAWSPDGTQISVHSNETGSAQIYIVDVATGTRRQITEGAFNNFRADWSPDGSRLIFTTNRNGDDDLFIVNADGSGLQPFIVAEGSQVSPAWRGSDALINFDENPNIPLSAVQVQEASVDGNTELGAGRYRVFAPAEAAADEFIRVRLEIELLDVEAVPEDDTPIANEGSITVFRFMGAELTGIDIDDFDIFPNPSAYLLQIQEDDTNYWEWYLTLAEGASVGSKLLFLEIYLPDIEGDEVTTKTMLRRIPLQIDIVSGQPDEETVSTEETDDDVTLTQDPAFRQPTLNPAEATEGFSVYLTSENLLAISFSDAVDVSAMSVATGVGDYTIAQIFPDVSELEFIVPATFCLFYERDGTGDAPPLACQTENRLERALNAADIFWYSSLARSLQDVIIRKDGETFICSPSFERCDF